MKCCRGSILLGLTILVTVVLTGYSNLAFAQAVLLPSEQRVNEMRFFAVHNAYQRSWPEESAWLGQENQITIAQQLDRYNVWHQEIDIIRWNGVYLTAHTCIDQRGLGLLADTFNAITNSQRYRESFFVITLSDNSSNFPFPCSPMADSVDENDLKSELNDLVSFHFDAEKIYTPANWVADGKQWPSPQELIRRGKRVAFYIGDMLGVGLLHNQDFDNPIISKQSAENSLNPRPDMHKFAFYTYPADIAEDDDNWETAMNYGYNFVGTTKMGLHWDDPRFHPPLPMYITYNSTSGPSAVTGRGAYADPYYADTPAKSFMAALNRIHAFESHGTTSIIRLNMLPGDYNMTGGNTTMLIDEALLIDPDQGPWIGSIVIR